MVGRIRISLVLFMLIMVTLTHGNSTAPAQVSTEWSPDIDDRFNTMNTITWTRQSQYDENHSLTTLVNGWSYVSAMSHPDVGTLESWSDIPNPNATFYSSHTGQETNSVFDAHYYPPYDTFQGQGQKWFNFILPSIVASTYWFLLETLTEGPWNHSITPQFFKDESTRLPIYWGYQYSFSHEGCFYNVSVNYWISAGFDDDEHFSGVIREGWVKVYNETTGNEIHMRRVRCSPAGPTVGGLVFVDSGEWGGTGHTGEYTEGETGNVIIWKPLFWPRGFEGGYGIYHNGTVIVPEQTSSGSPHWRATNANELNQSIDGLEPGLHNFTLILRDVTHNTHALTFMLTVLPYDYTTDYLILGGTLALIGVGLFVFRSWRGRVPE